jgi:hypothetical protein
MPTSQFQFNSNSIRFKSAIKSPTFTGTVSGSSAMVGLGNVDNTSDLNKPVSNAAAALDLKLQLYKFRFKHHSNSGFHRNGRCFCDGRFRKCRQYK